MGYLTRLYTFAVGSFVVAVEENAELDNIHNRFNGTNVGEILVISGSASSGAIQAKQNGPSTWIAEFYDDLGVKVATVEKIPAGQLPAYDNGLITKGALGVQKSYFAIPFFFGGVPPASTRSERFIAPTAHFKLTGIHTVCEDKTGGGASGTITFRIYKQPQDGTGGAAIIQICEQILVNNANLIVAGKTYPQAMTPINPYPLGLGDSVYIEVQNNTDGKMRKFTVVLVGYSVLEP